MGATLVDSDQISKDLPRGERRERLQPQAWRDEGNGIRDGRSTSLGAWLPGAMLGWLQCCQCYRAPRSRRVVLEVNLVDSWKLGAWLELSSSLSLRRNGR